MSNKTSEKKETEKEKDVRQPENMVVYDPSKPLYSREHLCIYLRELYDMAEKELEEAKQKSNKEDDERNEK